MAQDIVRFHPNAIDLTGERFERLLVVRPLGRKGGSIVWLCRCDCGRDVEVRSGGLRNGGTKSCGCWKRDMAAKRVTKHGMSNSGPDHCSEYTIWAGMIQRCHNPNSRNYPDYGGRGVEVCAAWRESFARFLADVGRRPSPLHSLDRHPDSDGNYEPDNCRWATRKEQARNRRSNNVLEYGGKSLTLAEWAERTGLGRGTIFARIRAGWSVADALTKPLCFAGKAKAEPADTINALAIKLRSMRLHLAASVGDDEAARLMEEAFRLSLTTESTP